MYFSLHFLSAFTAFSDCFLKADLPSSSLSQRKSESRIEDILRTMDSLFFFYIQTGLRVERFLFFQIVRNFFIGRFDFIGIGDKAFGFLPVFLIEQSLLVKRETVDLFLG